MSRIPSSFLALPTWLAAGCLATAGNVDDGGQSGTARPPMCVEDTRTEVTDLEVAPPSFTVTAAELLDGIEGRWSGTGTLAVDASDLGVTFDVALAEGPVFAVTSHLEDDDEGPGQGAPPPDCSPFYVFPVATSFVGDTHGLAADGETDLTAADPSWLSLSSWTDLDDVAGELAPTAFVPEEWDRAGVTADLFLAPDDTTLTLTWSASREPAAAARSASTASTGTVTVSGMSEPLLTASGLTRP